MSYLQMLSIVANWAAILTAVIASGVSFWLWHEQCSKRKKLEKYLRSEKEKLNDKGQRSLMHLMRKLSMTEADIQHAAFRSKSVEPRIKNGDDGFAETLLFEYTGRK